MKERRFAQGMVLVALSSGVSAVELAPKGMPVGDGARLYASVSLIETHNDNIFKTAQNETESWITQVTPSLNLVTRRGESQYSIGYFGDYGCWCRTWWCNYFI